jgi:hypothetical protein
MSPSVPVKITMNHTGEAESTATVLSTSAPNVQVDIAKSKSAVKISMPVKKGIFESFTAKPISESSYPLSSHSAVTANKASNKSSFGSTSSTSVKGIKNVLKVTAKPQIDVGVWTTLPAANKNVSKVGKPDSSKSSVKSKSANLYDTLVETEAANLEETVSADEVISLKDNDKRYKKTTSPTHSQFTTKSKASSGVVLKSSNSWANVASFAPPILETVPQAFYTEKETKASLLFPPQAADFPAISASPFDQRSSSVAVAIHSSRSWGNVATTESAPQTAVTTPSAETDAALLSDDNEAFQVGQVKRLPTMADFLTTLSPSPPKTPALAVVSYVKTVGFPPSLLPANPVKVCTDVLPQPMVSAVVDQKLDTFHDMIRTERQNLFRGPLITIWVGTIPIQEIFKRVTMCLSQVLNEHFT